MVRIQLSRFFVYRWQVLSSDIAPFNMLSSSCLGLSNDEVLILGSNYLDGAKKSAIYNLANDTWTLLGKKLKMYGYVFRTANLYQHRSSSETVDASKYLVKVSA